MILFIIFAACILLFTIFADDGLICDIKNSAKSDRPFLKILINIWSCFWYNVLLNVVNWVAVIVISMTMFFAFAFVYPSETSQWEFGINALEDNLVTEGHYYGRRGYIDGELSYFYSRTLAAGERIGHIPADKTYIRYDNDSHPHVEVHNKRVDVPDWLSKLLFIDWMNSWSTEYYVLIVPEGTITNTGEYAIDMK